jgi:hypothetical protein
MNREPIHHAPVHDEAPTTRLRTISDDDDIDAVHRMEESSDEPSSALIEPSAVIGLDAESSFSVGFDDTPRH